MLPDRSAISSVFCDLTNGLKLSLPCIFIWSSGALYAIEKPLNSLTGIRLKSVKFLKSGNDALMLEPKFTSFCPIKIASAPLKV